MRYTNVLWAAVLSVFCDRQLHIRAVGLCITCICNSLTILVWYPSYIFLYNTHQYSLWRYLVSIYTQESPQWRLEPVLYALQIERSNNRPSCYIHPTYAIRISVLHTSSLTCAPPCDIHSLGRDTLSWNFVSCDPINQSIEIDSQYSGRDMLSWKRSINSVQAINQSQRWIIEKRKRGYEKTQSP